MRSARRRWMNRILLMLSVLASCCAFSLAQQGGSVPEPRTVPGEVIIRLAEGITPADVTAIAEAMASSPGAGSRLVFSRLPQQDQLPPGLHAKLATRSPGAVQRMNEAIDALRDVFVVSLASDEAADRLLIDLAGDSRVIYAEPHRIVDTAMVPNDPFYSSSGSWGQPYLDLWGLHLVDAEHAWDLAKGTGVVVGVSDTGVDINHPELVDRIWAHPGEDLNGNGVVDGAPLDCSQQPLPPPDGDFNCIDDDGNGYVDDVRGWDFFENDNDPDDTHGHGTHVSGTIAAEGNNSTGVIGLAFEARILPIRGFGPTGSTTMEMAAQTVTYAALVGVDVLNMSWGGVGEHTALKDAIHAANQAGVLLVAAAGNDAMDVKNYYPANFPGVMAIAATNQVDVDADFSNYGSGISVSAPGGDHRDPDDPNLTYNNVLSLKSADAQTMDSPTLTVEEKYYRARGTSMASPHVAGLGALVKSYHPEISAGLIQVVIESSADDIGEPGFDPLTGNGRINARAALELSDMAVTRAELVATLGPASTIAAQDGPFTLAVEVKNVSVVGARDITLELHDGQPGIGSQVLDTWMVKDLAPGATYAEKRIYALADPGAHELVLVVDPRGNIPETSRVNNQASAAVHVMKYQWIESVVSEVPGVYQLSPTVSGNFVTWVDSRTGNSEIYLYDLADGSEKSLTNVDSSKSDPVVSDMTVVWIDRRDSRRDLYAMDLDTGLESVITTVDASRGAPAIDGETVTWSDSRFGNFDVFAFDLDGGGESVIADGPAPEYSPAISEKKITWYSALDGIYELHLYDMSTGSDEIIVSGPEVTISPDIASSGLVYTRGNSFLPKQFDLDIYLRRTGQTESELLTPGTGYKNVPAISSSTIAWLEGLFFSDLVAYDLGSGAQPRIVNGMINGKPDTDGGTIVWAECRHPLQTTCPPGIYMAQTDTLPRAPRDFSARSAGSTSISLDWTDSTESDLSAYRVYRRVATNSPYQLIGSTVDSSFRDTGLRTGKRYYYRVTAVDLQNGEGSFTPEQSAVPRQPCRDCPDMQEVPNGDNR